MSHGVRHGKVFSHFFHVHGISDGKGGGTGL
jgi:hypothetical protein